MRIAYITAGAAGMFCGSCLHDNTLVAELCRQGHDALLVPTYTPIRTDEEDVSQKRVFFGGINVFLQQKLALFRHTPWFFDRWLDARALLRWVSRFAAGTKAEDLGDLTLSMLEGEHGRQKKELDKLVGWLADDVRPDIVNLSNALISGMVHAIKDKLGCRVICTLQGDDVFLEALPERFRTRALDLIRQHCQEIDGFVATSRYYADFMAGYLGIPREKIEVIYPGLKLDGHGLATDPRSSDTLTLGYFARICPEKGLHLLAEAFSLLRKASPATCCRLRVSGWLGNDQREYLATIRRQVDDLEHVDCPDHASKVRFLQSLDILSVPTVYREPKGLYVLEAWANAVPVVQPRHGSFPELLEVSGGGVLVEPENAQDLARGLQSLLENPQLRHEMGQKGRAAVHESFTAAKMARTTYDYYVRLLEQANR
jgi:glycosyltransferase involved in cell wall biosynthesis